MAAKKVQSKISLDDSPEIKSVSYRIERVTTEAWRAFKVSVYEDGASTEERIFKEDLWDLVLQNVNRNMRSEGNAPFEMKKKLNA